MYLVCVIVVEMIAGLIIVGRWIPLTFIAFAWLLYFLSNVYWSIVLGWREAMKFLLYGMFTSDLCLSIIEVLRKNIIHYDKLTL